MKFSVLMSIYHKESPKYFYECMQSIWDEQTVKPDEIVLVKDGVLSQELDNIITSWQQKIGQCFKVIALPSNQGTGKAKNIGIEYCSHDIVCVVDTDDICVKERFEKQLAFFAKHPDATVVGGQIDEFVCHKTHITGSRLVPLRHRQLQHFAQRQSPFNHMTVAYKKQAVIQAGGYQHHLYMEDYNLFLRLIAQGAVLYNLPDCLVYARIDNGMHQRRRGWSYVKSEWQLYQLKCTLKLQNPIAGFGWFVVRAIPRVLPVFVLSSLYRMLRQSPKKTSN